MSSQTDTFLTAANTSAGNEAERKPLNMEPQTTRNWRFDPVDIVQMRLLAQLSPGQRVRVMLEAQELARGLIMGRLRRQFPDASERELALKFLEEVARADRTCLGP